MLSATDAQCKETCKYATDGLCEDGEPDTVFEFKIDTENKAYPWVSWGALIPG